MNFVADQQLIDLVDAVMNAVDVSRWDEISRLREAFAPFGPVELFDAELRLNARPSAEHRCCFGESVSELVDA